jgi:hypothetical protein
VWKRWGQGYKESSSLFRLAHILLIPLAAPVAPWRTGQGSSPGTASLGDSRIAAPMRKGRPFESPAVVRCGGACAAREAEKKEDKVPGRRDRLQRRRKQERRNSAVAAPRSITLPATRAAAYNTRGASPPPTVS